MTRNEPPDMHPQAMVEQFHRLFDIVVQERPDLVDERTRVLRERLIQEEFDELKEAMGKADLPAIAKELADLLYVVYGTAVSYGIDMTPVFREVHRSNMNAKMANGSNRRPTRRRRLRPSWRSNRRLVSGC